MDKETPQEERLTVKLGKYEFDSHGPCDVVKAQYKEFLVMAAAMIKAEAEERKNKQTFA